MKRTLACTLVALYACEEGTDDWKTIDIAERPTPGDAAPAAAPAVEDEVEELEFSAAFPYPSPMVEEARALRRGRKVSLRLVWAAVEGNGLQYQAQVSRTLTFSRRVKEGQVRKTRYIARKLEPMVYFWRVRAVGELGDGAWSDVQVLDATRSGRRGRRRLVAAAEVNLPREPVAVRKGRNPPLRLVWRKPLHRMVTTKSPVLVEGVATRGTLVNVGGRTEVEVASTFSVPYALAHGRNPIAVVGRLGDQEKSLQRVVYYADPARLAPIRERFEELRGQLEEIAAIRDELAETVASLEARLHEERDEALVAEIKAEVGRVAQIRREIDREINTAIGDLDRLLTSHE